jgi:hypothetical protein
MMRLTRKGGNFSFSPNIRIWNKDYFRGNFQTPSSRIVDDHIISSKRFKSNKNKSFIKINCFGGPKHPKSKSTFFHSKESKLEYSEVESVQKIANKEHLVKLPFLHKIRVHSRIPLENDSDSELKKSTGDSEITKMCSIAIGTDEEPEERFEVISLKSKSKKGPKILLKSREIISPFDIFPPHPALPDNSSHPESNCIKSLRLKRLLI